jgi:large subunit ribosomal protein L1
MRSKRYKEIVSKIDKKKDYSIDEAIKLVKETSNIKFDSSVEVHLRLGIDPKKGEQTVRGNVLLPHGIGKSKRIAVFSEDEKTAKDAGADLVGGENLIKEIKSKGKIDFDLALATPSMMKNLAGAAKILGPKGLMPSPKAGTVVAGKDLAQAIKEIKKGKVNFKNDDTGNIHQIIGKASWPESKLKENLEVFIDEVKKAKPAAAKGIFIRTVYLTSTMGPAVKVSL